MVGDIVMLPVRLGTRAASLALRGTESAVNQAVTVAGRVLGGRPSNAPAYSPPSPERRQAAAAPTPPQTATPDIYAETPPEPVHVSEEPSLVEELAEPGAEDGAGAEVRVEEPWSGYRGLTARDVIDRVAAYGPAELAAVQLYEGLHQNRPTVLEAVERRLAELTAGDHPTD
jgi:hypothetical protein